MGSSEAGSLLIRGLKDVLPTIQSRVMTCPNIIYIKRRKERIMKKILLGLLISFLIISAASPAQAALKTIKIPTIIQVSAEQLQKAIDSLITKTDNHDSRIIELEKKVKALEERVAKLEAKLVVNDGISNAQQSQGIKESSEAIPPNQLQQDSSSLNQKISDFLSGSSNHIEANQAIDFNTSIKDIGDIKLGK